MNQAGKINKSHLIITILIILLIATATYILIDKSQQREQEGLLNAFQQGAQYGYTQAIATLISEAEKCVPVPVFFENKTINIIDVSCLQQENN